MSVVRMVRGRQTQPAVPQQAAQRREAVQRAEKSDVVTALNQVFKDTGTVIVAQYAGLTVADMTSLRGRMRAAV